ncbi:MAG: FkbM family methyltransferase [Actinomycetota bacterium]|nr:FkbM family methyltransferase [Actinomycetota bacterium]
MRLPWTARRQADAPAAQRGPTVPSLGNGIAVPITPGMCRELLESLRADEPVAADPDHFIDWSGVRTRVAMLPWAPAELAGTISEALPIPDDGYRSEDVEYAGLAQAINTAEGTFRIVEVGAGWAPWTVSGVVTAKRRGLQAFGVAVEADPVRCRWAVQHAQDNGLAVALAEGNPDELAARVAAADPGLDVLVVRAAGWHSRTVLQFPDIPDDDMGAAVWTLPGTDVDYRGVHLTHHDVPAVAIADLLAGPTRTDLLHIDVQGVEFELLEPASDVIQQNARLMAVGTTDRLTEGLLQRHFLARGWGLIVDQPCATNFTMTHPTLAGFTIQDGNQLWENPFLREWPAS